MALIRGAFMGGQIKGSVSGSTFQQGKYGQVIRNRTVPVNPNSTGQASVREAMSLASSAWGQILTAEERAAWDDYAAKTTLPNKFGDNIHVSGRNMFIRSAVPAVLAGVAIQTVSPATPDIALNKLITVTMSEADGIELTGVSPTMTTGQLVQLSLSVPLNPTNNYYKGPFKTGLYIDDSTTFPVMLKAPGSNLVEGQRYFIRHRTSDANGKVSNFKITNLGEVAA